MIKHEVQLGKIVHGDTDKILSVKTPTVELELRQHITKIGEFLSRPSAPSLILIPHCAECEFQTRCRQRALENDELTLLSGMTEKERNKLHEKGIFTVTQLSYTFRPRRRSKRASDKGEKYDHSLRALAIRQKKIHIVGTPELALTGTTVYLDVEGLPDRDSYYRRRRDSTGKRNNRTTLSYSPSIPAGDPTRHGGLSSGCHSGGRRRFRQDDA